MVNIVNFTFSIADKSVQNVGWKTVKLAVNNKSIKQCDAYGDYTNDDDDDDFIFRPSIINTTLLSVAVLSVKVAILTSLSSSLTHLICFDGVIQRSINFTEKLDFYEILIQHTFSH